jgi:hypothetical protein
MALLNTFHTSEFREGWGRDIADGTCAELCAAIYAACDPPGLAGDGIALLLLEGFSEREPWG